MACRSRGILAAAAALLLGCEATLSTAPPATAETPPAHAGDESAEDKQAKKQADDQTAQIKAEKAKAEEEDKANEEALAKEEAKAAADKKAKAAQELAKKKAHEEECTKTFPARLWTIQAAIKKVPKACEWLIANCENKKVIVSKKQGSETVTFAETRFVCSGSTPPGVGDPQSWWAKNESACTVTASALDQTCTDVDPVALSGTPLDEIAAYKAKP